MAKLTYQCISPLIRLEKEKHALRVDLDDLLAQLDISNKGKASAENMNKQLEASISKMTVKMNDYTRQITDLNAVKGKIAAELGDCQRALEASEANFQQVWPWVGSTNGLK